MNKKAMQTSVNAIVGIILGMLMLTAGIVIFKQIVDQSQRTLPIVEEGIRRQMEDAFNTGELLYVPTTDKTVSTGKSTDFYFAIRNINEEERIFSFDITNVGNTNNFPTLAFFGPNEQHTIESQDKEVFRVVATTKGLDRGTYSMLITIYIHDSNGENQEIYEKRIVRLNVR